MAFKAKTKTMLEAAFDYGYRLGRQAGREESDTARKLDTAKEASCLKVIAQLETEGVVK